MRALRKRCVLLSTALIAAVAVATGTSSAQRATTASGGPELVIEDNDFRGPAGSDIQSVLPLLGNPNVEVLGFTVVTGDAWENAEAAALLRFLEVAKLHVPVYDGAVYPLVNTVDAWRLREQQYGVIAWKGAWGGHGSIANIPSTEPPIPALPQGAPITTTQPGTAAAFLIREVHAHPHAVTILAAGPLTNIALAIRLDPTFAATAKGLVVMGGIIDQNMADLIGNAAFSEDFNFMFDPEAAHITLTAAWPTVIDLGAVSGNVLYSPEIERRIAVKDTPVTRFLTTYYERLPMWDEVASAVAADPSLITKSVDAYMDVDLSPGMNYGHAHVWPDALAPRVTGLRKVTVVQAFDEVRFVDEFVRSAQALP